MRNLLLSALLVATAASAAMMPEESAVARARKQVRMLSDLYGTAVVLMTENYVEDASSTSAATLTVKIFKAMKEKGYHDASLIDATGQPLNPGNVAKDDFERAAAERIKAGDTWYEQVTERDGKPYFRAATPVPLLMQKCVYCHPNYEGAKLGEVVGLVSYGVAIE